MLLGCCRMLLESVEFYWAAVGIHEVPLGSLGSMVSHWGGLGDNHSGTSPTPCHTVMPHQPPHHSCVPSCPPMSPDIPSVPSSCC